MKKHVSGLHAKTEILKYKKYKNTGKKYKKIYKTHPDSRFNIAVSLLLACTTLLVAVNALKS